MTLIWTLSFFLQLLILGLLAVPIDESGVDGNSCEQHRGGAGISVDCHQYKIGYSGAGFQCDVTGSDTFFVDNDVISDYAATKLGEITAWSVVEGTDLKGVPKECTKHGLAVSAAELNGFPDPPEANLPQHTVVVFISHQSWYQKKVSKKMGSQKTSKNAVKGSHEHHSATQATLPDAEICALAAYPNPTEKNPGPDFVFCKKVVK